MNTSELFGRINDTIMQSLPSDVAWVPYVGMLSIGALGFLLMVKGARFAPTLLAFLLLVGGAIAGRAAAAQFGTPVLPTVGIVAAAAMISGFLLFRMWLSIVVSAFFVLAGLGVYESRVLHEPLSRFQLPEGEVTLPAEGTVVGTTGGPWQVVSERWSFLTSEVPNFQVSVFSIISVLGLAGAIFAAFLPRLSRALWAATTGVLLAGIGLSMLLDRLFPSALEWLMSNNAAAWMGVGVLWVGSVLLNFADIRKPKARISVEPQGEAATA